MRQKTTLTSLPFTGTPHTPIHQRGMSLIELMVGIAIGLLVVAVASGALMVSRGVSGTVSDASVLQQQAGYAFRVIGQQLRQTGSLYLNMNVSQNTSTDIDQYALPVAFETKATSDNTGNGFDPLKDSIQGTDTTLQLAYRRYQDKVFQQKITDPSLQSMSRDCQGGPSDESDNSSHMRIQSRFSLSGTDLMCQGTKGGTTAMLNNVANYQVRYIQATAAGTGDTKTKYVNATAAGSNWGQITGVEVCLVLFGTEAMNLPTGTTYTDCDGTTKVDMSQSSLGANRTQRMHMVFRNVYQLRSQGLLDKLL